MINPQDTARSLIILARILMVGSVTLIIIATTLGAYLFLTPASAAQSATIHKNAAKNQVHRPRKRPVVSPSKYQEEVETISQQYMNAFMQGHYDVMWSMLHPKVQAQWPNEEAFATAMKRRFQNFKLDSFTTGKVNDVSYWVNQETMTRYNQVEVQTISLQLTAQGSSGKVGTLPTIDQHASDILQNLPFIVQRATLGAGKGEGKQWYILNSGPTDPEAPILPPLTPVTRTVKVPILMYHYISGVPKDDANPVLRQSLSVSPTEFSQQLDYFKEQGYHSITFNQLLNAMYYEAPLPVKPIIFTFDDGYDDAYTAAYPALKAHGYSGMFYIITGKVGWQGQSSWDQLREMVTNGMQMGSHTIHHVEIGKTYQNSQEQARQEVEISQQEMQKQLGIIIQHFCYPNGDPFKGNNVALQQKITNLLENQNYSDATTDPGPTGTLQSSDTPFALLRLRIDGRSSLDSFISMMKANA